MRRSDDETRLELPCQQNPDMWFPEGVSRTARMTAELAIRRCRECPALAACMEHTARVRPKPQYGVWAGRDYTVERVNG